MADLIPSNASESSRLRIKEIFFSLQGESSRVGLPTVFVRLTGCPLRCGYCDTEYAFSGGDWMTLDEIVDKVASYGTHWVCVTGGEPLSQKPCAALLTKLCDADYEVSLETSGALDVSVVDSRVMKVLDLKTPGSGETDRNRYENIDYLLPKDQVKFVITSRDDYDWSVAAMKEHDLVKKSEVLFSPVHGHLDPEKLADWIIQDGVKVRFQVQLHKYLWDDQPGR